MQKSESIGELAKSLAIAQGRIEGAKKDSENPFFHSKYADLASVWEACRKPLSENGLAVVQTTEPEDENGSIPVETMLLHSSGEWILGSLKVRPVKDDPQAMGSAITYARRYALAAMVGVAPEDDDANAASRPYEPARARKAKDSNGKGQAETEITSLKKAAVDACQLLNKAGDTPPWTAGRLNEFAVQQYGLKADELELEPLRELVKKLSVRLDEVKKGAGPSVSGGKASRTEIERQAKLAEMQHKLPADALTQELKRLYPEKQIESLTLDELINLESEIVPF